MSDSLASFFPVGELYDIGRGQKLYLSCIGKGLPTGSYEMIKFVIMIFHYFGIPLLESYLFDFRSSISCFALLNDWFYWQWFCQAAHCPSNSQFQFIYDFKNLVGDVRPSVNIYFFGYPPLLLGRLFWEFTSWYYALVRTIAQSPIFRFPTIFTVILDAPTGMSSDVWSSVQERVAKVTRVCVYDRAGIGFSDRPPPIKVSTKWNKKSIREK